MNCPRCNSNKFRISGFTKVGSPRYRCRDCDKTWSDKPVGRPPLGEETMSNSEYQRRFLAKRKKK
jgi:hypothetical protein